MHLFCYIYWNPIIKLSELQYKLELFRSRELISDTEINYYIETLFNTIQLFNKYNIANYTINEHIIYTKILNDEYIEKIVNGDLSILKNKLVPSIEFNICQYVDPFYRLSNYLCLMAITDTNNYYTIFSYILDNNLHNIRGGYYTRSWLSDDFMGSNVLTTCEGMLEFLLQLYIKQNQIIYRIEVGLYQEPFSVVDFYKLYTGNLYRMGSFFYTNDNTLRKHVRYYTFLQKFHEEYILKYLDVNFSTKLGDPQTHLKNVHHFCRKIFPVICRAHYFYKLLGGSNDYFINDKTKLDTLLYSR